MKNRISNLIGVASVLAIAVSCDKNDSLTIPQDQASIKSELYGGKYSVEIKYDGQWSASVNEEDEWIQPVESSFGSDKLFFVVQENDRDEGSRTGHITISSDTETKTITVTQSDNITGQIPSNAATESGTIDIAYNKGLGSGLDITTGKIKTANIISMQSIAEHEDANEILSKDIEPNLSLQQQDIEEEKDKHDSIKVELSISVSFASFELKIGGAYESNEDVIDHHYYYPQSYKVKAATSAVQIEDIFLYAYDNEEEISVRNSYKKLINKTFRKKYEAVLSAWESQNNTKLNAAIDELDKKYGAAVITESTLGGDLFLNINIDQDQVDDEMKINGYVDGNVSIAGININANVDVKYSKESHNLMKKATIETTMIGGNAQEQNDIAEALSSMKATEYEQSKTDLANKIVAWGRTIKYSDSWTDNTSGLIDYSCIGIWNLFQDAELSAYVEKRLKDKYGDIPESFISINRFNENESAGN